MLEDLKTSPKIFICGGGTGGHFFSGVALAEEFLTLYPEFSVLFFGTRLGIEGRTSLSDPRMSVHFIRSKGLKGKGLIAKIQGVLWMSVGFFQSLMFLLRHRPKIIFGVGGYASAPILMAAILTRPFLGHRVGVLEQNSSPGLANRLFSFFCQDSYSGFPHSRFKLVNLPLRKATLEKSKTAPASQWPPRTIFVLGGSQGAKGLNARFRDLLPSLVKKFSTIKIIHQTGREDESAFRDFYKMHGVEAEVFAFSSEMPNYYEKADLLICRSGAMTVFEVMEFKRPAIFVPFPAATDDHQKKNALFVQKSEWVIDEKDWTSERVLALLSLSAPSFVGRDSETVALWPDIFKSMLGGAGYAKTS